jgi:hypothetical protein
MRKFEQLPEYGRYDERPLGAPIHDGGYEPDSGPMFRPIAMGSWSVSSVSDSRWNANGSGPVGGFTMPEDLMYECMKD